MKNKKYRIVWISRISGESGYVSEVKKDSSFGKTYDKDSSAVFNSTKEAEKYVNEIVNSGEDGYEFYLDTV